MLHISLGSLVAAAFIIAAPAASGAPAGQPRPLRILVSNDDGYAAPGIDALVEALRELPRVKVTVVAPSENQSGAGGGRSPEPVAATKEQTVSGYPALAVDGTPADSVIYALDELAKPPQLVISGVNEGQNLGPVVDISGTVGAARAAAQEGIPAVAVSQGAGDPPDYAEGAEAAADWVKEHRRALVRGDVAATTVLNINVPTCATGAVRGEIEVPAATTGDAGTASDCTSTLEDPPDDVIAFANGYVTLSEIPTG
jgi:5'-nucleotidase